MSDVVATTSEPVGFPGFDDPAAHRFISGRVALISQYAQSPIITSLIDLLSEAIDRLVDFETFIRGIWNIDTAIGVGLDIWGRIVGVERVLTIPAGDYLGFTHATGSDTFNHGVFYGHGVATSNYRLSDEAYRRLILAKAALNITNGATPAINTILRALFPDHDNAHVRDNADMSMTFVFGQQLSKVDYAIVTQSGALPRPVGVSVTIEQP